MSEDKPDETTVRLLIEDARGVLDERIGDYAAMKREAQQNFSVSALLVGLLLNLIAGSFIDLSGCTSRWLMGAATIALFLVALLSLASQFLREVYVGRIEPKCMEEKYLTRMPDDVRLRQLTILIKDNEEAIALVKRRAKLNNAGRILLIIAVAMIGVTALLGLAGMISQ